MQTNQTTRELQIRPTEKSWAFAVDIQRIRSKRRRVRHTKRAITNVNRAIITAVSKEAKLFGVRTGMRYEEAKRLVPELRILVIGGKTT